MAAAGEAMRSRVRARRRGRRRFMGESPGRRALRLEIRDSA
jgi:hypothetical protein